MFYFLPFHLVLFILEGNEETWAKDGMGRIKGALIERGEGKSKKRTIYGKVLEFIIFADDGRGFLGLFSLGFLNGFGGGGFRVRGGHGERFFGVLVFGG